MADAIGCAPGNVVMQADAQAYIQAELKGPPTWVALPRDAWPQKWLDMDYRKPVCRLKKALYGHPSAGGFWEEHCDARCQEAGFEPIEAWPSCYYNSELKQFLVVYVDDFKMAGPVETMQKAWDKLRNKLLLDKELPANLFLGC